MKLLEKFTKHTKLLRAISATIIAIGMGVILAVSAYRYQHRNDLTPNTTPPQTGLVLVFSPTLSNPAHLTIENSSEKEVKSAMLVKSRSEKLSQSINNPFANKYYLELPEGVYRLKITSTRDDFLPYTATVTIPNHALTTQFIQYAHPK